MTIEVSIGLASLASLASLDRVARPSADEALAAADEAMYRAQGPRSDVRKGPATAGSA